MVKVDLCEKCRFDRHRCPANCRYAQFFPLGTADDYKAIHGVFGPRKFLSIVDRADPEQNLASRSLIRQARARVEDPVNGLGGTANLLRGQVNELRAELISLGIPIRGGVAPQEAPEEEQPVQNGRSCGACKHLKKKCPSTCPLRAIFTPQRSDDLDIVDAFYGVRQFISNMENVPPANRRLAAETMVLESWAWNELPATGIVGLVNILKMQVLSFTRKLNLAKGAS
ncbi:hypothetical protein MKW92_048611 [Papaver armeniacum]|nr:hypothetical protein MKW92_048611 [Papaver armeniacum]